MRSVIAGTALAVATLVAALGFATNVRALTHDPHLYGWNWDVALREGQGFGSLDTRLLASILDADADVEAWSSAFVGDDLVDGHDVPLFGMSPSARVRPSLLDGRFIESADEIVLGAASADAVHAKIGDTVTLGSGANAHVLEVVGTAALPSIGGQHVLHPSLGLGGVVAPERIPGGADTSSNEQGPSLAFIRFRTSAGPSQIQHLADVTEPLGSTGDIDILTAQRPSEIVSAASLGNTPLIVAATFGGMAALGICVALIASVRRSRRELALLRTLGFDDAQMTMTIVWHTYTLVIAGTIIGLPLGLVSSAWLWNAFVEQLDLVGVNHLPVRLIAIVAAAAMGVGGVAAVTPASIARRLSPARAMRAP